VLTPGSSGVFEITVDGVIRYSKRRTGRFPSEAEIDACVTSGD
jgi:selT/selW/selH-like putative selenoprotein